MSKNKEILYVAEAVSNEKGVAKDIIFKAIETALEMVTRKHHHDNEMDVRVSIDQRTGDYDTFRRWEVIADFDPNDPPEEYFPQRQLTLTEAKKKYPNAKIGTFVEDPMESVEFGRIAAQMAKQIIVR